MMQFKFPMQITFSEVQNALSRSKVSLLVNVVLSTDGGLYVLMRMNYL